MTDIEILYVRVKPTEPPVVYPWLPTIEEVEEYENT
jgi:hypothetical protein